MFNIFQSIWQGSTEVQNLTEMIIGKINLFQGYSVGFGFIKRRQNQFVVSEAENLTNDRFTIGENDDIFNFCVKLRAEYDYK